ncbi:MAG: hypothetical protein GY765_21620, partial [bacterium]|nr:hypothetical protein [bacterium]
MSKLKKKLNFLHKDKIQTSWDSIEEQEGLSTKEKLAKLVDLNLKRDLRKEEEPPSEVTEALPLESETESDGFIVRDYTHPLSSSVGKFQLLQWRHVSSRDLVLVTGDEEFADVSPQELLFFDTETTGLSGGTGTIPFMLGFGYFDGDNFSTKIFILNDPAREGEFLNSVDHFIEAHRFSATVTYNGKAFDFPLMETRYILQRKRFPLLKLPHLDFLFPARTLWKHTYASRRLSYLGDILLGLSRDEDVESSQIPALYFNYLRSRSFSLIEQVVEHNVLDLMGLAGLLLLGIKYLEDISYTDDEGEILGIAKLYEKSGDFEKASDLYNEIKKMSVKSDILEKAVKGLAIIKKKNKLYSNRDAKRNGWEEIAEALGEELGLDGDAA